MIEIRFSGWFQARFATDPDAYDHRRGDQGWTFAVAGEPDFDRVIRFRAPVALRSHAPVPDVRVTEVVVNGVATPGHVLVGAAVDLQGGPKFEGHNGDIAPDGREPVFPFNLRIAQGGVSLGTNEWLALGDLRRPIGARRRGQGVGRMPPTVLATVLGGDSPQQYMTRRRQQLEGDRAATADATAREALQQRLDTFERSAQGGSAGMLSVAVNYAFDVPAASRVLEDPQGRLNATPGGTWSARYTMGAWDRDALQGHVFGALVLA